MFTEPLSLRVILYIYIYIKTTVFGLSSLTQGDRGGSVLSWDTLYNVANRRYFIIMNRQYTRRIPEILSPHPSKSIKQYR